MNQIQFTSAVYKHSNLLMSHALKFTHDEDDAKDLLQETLIKGMRFSDSFDEGTNIKGWLYVIMRNTYLNNFKKAAKRNALFVVESEADHSMHIINSTTNDAETVFAMADIQKAMATLKFEYRFAFQKFFEGYKYVEIAEELEMPVGTVKTYIHQARLGLKKYLTRYRAM